MIAAAGAWLLGKAKSVWPWLLLAGAALAAFLGALKFAERAGERAEQLRQAERTLRAEKERTNTDAKVSRLPDADLDRDLGRWMRKPGS